MQALWTAASVIGIAEHSRKKRKDLLISFETVSPIILALIPDVAISLYHKIATSFYLKLLMCSMFNVVMRSESQKLLFGNLFLEVFETPYNGFYFFLKNY